MRSPGGVRRHEPLVFGVAVEQGSLVAGLVGRFGRVGGLTVVRFRARADRGAEQPHR
ncbi:hypothetical protein [uncultured Thiocystis sp.]|jgi:hypothetical protein|uniref:hypothetical protein n=1 Tax=uncultured Thiocystis sp. TaxID=1202134 RepID=UPI0025E6C3B2|nr:hypothetical protein [uncultured Thiocystis sp.]